MNRIAGVLGLLWLIASCSALAVEQKLTTAKIDSIDNTRVITNSNGEVINAQDATVINANNDAQHIVQQVMAKKFTTLAEETPLVYVYTPDEINQWVEKGNHVYVMQEINQCQFSVDIKQRARKGMAAAYQFLYGELLLNGVCFARNEGAGIYYIQQAVDLGYPAAMRKLAFFYEIGRYLQQDIRRAEALMHEAAMMGYVPARIDWGGMLARNLGSPRDYEEAYSWLHNIVPSSPAQANRTREYMALLRKKMPENIIDRAMRNRYY